MEEAVEEASASSEEKGEELIRIEACCCCRYRGSCSEAEKGEFCFVFGEEEEEEGVG